MHARILVLALLLAAPVRADGRSPASPQAVQVQRETAGGAGVAATTQEQAVVAGAVDAAKLAATVPGAPAWVPWVTFGIVAGVGTAATILGIVEAHRLGDVVPMSAAMAGSP